MRFNIPESVTRAVAQQVLVAKRNSPHIFFGAGIVGAVGSAVLACRATLKLEATLDEIKTDVEKVNIAHEAEHLTKDEYYRLMALKYGRGVLKLGRLYGPSIVVGSISIAALAGSHTQLTRRNTALSGALAVMSQAFEEYRGRVRDEVGEEKELDLYLGAREETLEIEGKKQLVKVIDENGLSQFSVVFGPDTSNRWNMHPDVNSLIIMGAQAYIQDEVNRHGFALLNDALEQLGFDRTSDGAIFGWVRSTPDESTRVVDFGMARIPQNRYFLDGKDNKVILDFNVDGVVYDKIDKIWGKGR